MVNMSEETTQEDTKENKSSIFSKSPGKKKSPAKERVERTKKSTSSLDETRNSMDDMFGAKSKSDARLSKEQQEAIKKENKKQAELKKIRAKEEKERKKRHEEELKNMQKQTKNGARSTSHDRNDNLDSSYISDGKVNDTTPNKTTHKPSSNTSKVRNISYIQCKVELLDGTTFQTSVDRRQKVDHLYAQVCEHIHLEERDYFGLIFIRNKKQVWLDPSKSIDRQMPDHKSKEVELLFAVKFYPPYPTQLQGDMTRYQLCLQVRKDIQAGHLPCAELTYSLLGSYTAQSELGDYDLEEHGDGISYLKRLPFLQGKSGEFYEKVAELHKAHRGMTPEQAEYHFLENARKLEFYGVTFHKACDGEGVPLDLGVSARGLFVYKDSQKLNRFAWPQITKLSYRQTNQVFYVTLRPIEFETHKHVLGFQMQNNDEARALWEDCSEHHTFFRLAEPEHITGLLDQMGFSSKFRFSGRTQHQMRRSLSMSSMSRAGSITRLSSARSVDGRL